VSGYDSNVTVNTHWLDRWAQDSHTDARLGFARYHVSVDEDGM
jgi:hypothetical protein